MRSIFFVLFFLLAFRGAQAQKLEAIANFVQTGVADGEKLVNAYILPLNRSMMVGLSNSTFNGVYDIEDSYKFSISINTSVVKVPGAETVFDVEKLGLEAVEAKNDPIAQTVFGKEESIKLVSKYGIISRLFSVKTPEGSGYSVMPLPYINMTYRMGKTTIGAQIIPPLMVPRLDVKVFLIGGNIQQDLGGILFLEDSPVGIYVAGGASILKGHTDLNVVPESVVVTVPLTDDREGPYDNQNLDIQYIGAYANFYATYKWEALTPFVGVGYGIGSTLIDLTGTYPVYTKTGNAFIGLRAEDVEDPFSSSGTYSRLKFDVGVRVDGEWLFGQLGYTMGNYGGPSIGLGVRF